MPGVAALLVGGLLCTAAWADPPGRVGRLAEIQGTVWIFDNTANEWVAADRNRPLTTGDRLATDNNGRAVINIGSTTVRMAPGSEVDFAQLDDQRMRLQLPQGGIAFRVRNQESAAQFGVDTVEGGFTPARPGFYRVDHSDNLSAAITINGELRFSAPDSSLTIPQGQRGEFWREGTVTHYTWANEAPDAFGNWILSEDQRESRLAPSQYVSAEMTGYEDLNAAGTWRTEPDYGNVWYPTQVAADWAPYRDGHWAFVPPWGWTWVDDAPWGFAPFHYGRWAFFGSRWGWVPGAYVAQPVYAPALVGWVGGGGGIGISIALGGGIGIGWIPLAPREVYYPPYAIGEARWRYFNPNVAPRAWRPEDRPIAAIAYANRVAPGGVTVVPEDVMRRHQAVGAAVRNVDADVVRRVATQAAQVSVVRPPAAPAAVRVAAPIGRPGVEARALPPPPNRVNGAVVRPGEGPTTGVRPADVRGENPAAVAARPAAPNARGGEVRAPQVPGPALTQTQPAVPQPAMPQRRGDVPPPPRSGSPAAEAARPQQSREPNAREQAPQRETAVPREQRQPPTQPTAREQAQPQREPQRMPEPVRESARPQAQPQVQREAPREAAPREAPPREQREPARAEPGHPNEQH